MVPLTTESAHNNNEDIMKGESNTTPDRGIISGADAFSSELQSSSVQQQQ